MRNRNRTWFVLLAALWCWLSSSDAMAMENGTGHSFFAAPDMPVQHGENSYFTQREDASFGDDTPLFFADERKHPTVGDDACLLGDEGWHKGESCPLAPVEEKNVSAQNVSAQHSQIQSLPGLTLSNRNPSTQAFSQASLPPDEFFATKVAGMTLPEKVGQLLMVGFRGLGEPQEESMQTIAEGIQQGKIGGVILFDYDVTTQNAVRNIVSLEQVGQLTSHLQRLASIPLFVGIDQEGGRVMRLKNNHGMPDLPSPKFLGAGPTEASAEVYALTAETLASIGINVNFAPSVDVDVDPLSPAIGKLGRSYSAESDVVIAHADVFARSLEQQGIMAAFKHFPGHGSAAADTHLGLADVTDTWEVKELEPYRHLLAEHAQAMVMVGHVFHRLFDEEYPASLSRNIITEILRKELGWQGLVITDDLDMQAISNYYSLKECAALALNAGVDVLLFGNNLQYDPELPEKLFLGVLDLVEEGQVSEERIDEACERVLRAKYRLYPARV